MMHLPATMVRPTRSRSGELLAICLLVLLTCTSAGAVVTAVTQGDAQELQVTASFADKQSVTPGERIELRLSRPLKQSEGKLAVLIGQADLTSLFDLTETSLRFNPTLLPLPLGESEATVYLVSPKNEWKEIARFVLRVAKEMPPAPPDQKKPEGEKNAQESSAASQQSAADEKSQNKSQAQADASKPGGQLPKTDGAQQDKTGQNKLDFIPSLTLSIKSQPAQSNFPASPRPDRPTFTDLNMQASFKSEMTRGLFNSQTQLDFVGSSFQKEALRFGELGDRAPQVDLSSYLMQFQLGKVRYQMGHFSFGTNRHLINSFSSRGLMMSLQLGKHGDFAMTAMNGTSIVGFGNFLGVDKRRHQLLSGTLGLEFIPKRPGGLRFEASVLDGWLQPVNGFSQGSVNDAERSRGLGFRLLGSDASQRLKLDTGFTRSQFISPSDPLVSQGNNVKPFPSIARNARYLDASYDILKGLALTKEKKINLTFAFRHERVDPLFRSLGASTQADKFSNEFSLTGAIGDINAQFTHTRFNDNLADIPSILKSLTRANTFLLGVPTAALFGSTDKPSPLLPRLSYSFNQTHQFGAAIPVRGGFESNLSAIPDQVSTNQGFSADWQIEKWRVGYKLNHSFQDNQQKGKELADLSNLVNGVAVGVAASPTLDINLDINVERANNIEARTNDQTLRLAPSVNWRMTKKSTFAGSFSTTVAGDAADTKNSRNIEYDMQWSYQFGFGKEKLKKLSGQFFIRYANQYARARNGAFAPIDLRKNQTVNLGLSFSIF